MSCRLLWSGCVSVISRSQLVGSHTPSRLKRFSHLWNHLEKLGWRLQPSIRIFCEEYLYQNHDRLRNVSQLIYRRRGVLMLIDQPRSGALERDIARQHLPECDSERIKVGTYVRSDPGKLFGTSVSRCPGKSSLNRNLGNRTIVSSRTFGQPQIDNFRVSNIVAMHADHDVAWFDVAMDQILLVDCFQASGDPRGHLQGV